MLASTLSFFFPTQHLLSPLHWIWSDSISILICLHVVMCINSCSFLWLQSIPSCVYAIVCLSNHLLMNNWWFPTFSFTKQAAAVNIRMQVFTGTYAFFSLSLGVEWLDQQVGIYLTFLRNCQTVSQSGCTIPVMCEFYFLHIFANTSYGKSFILDILVGISLWF